MAFDLGDFQGSETLSCPRESAYKSWGSGRGVGWDLDCGLPWESTLMNAVKMQINTSLKGSFILFPKEEVYLSGWGEAAEDRDSY